MVVEVTTEGGEVMEDDGVVEVGVDGEAEEDGVDGEVTDGLTTMEVTAMDGQAGGTTHCITRPW